MQQNKLADAEEVFGAADLALTPISAPALPARVPQPTNVVTPADLLNIAMQTGDKDMERLERLMAMDIRYRELQEKDRQRDAMLAFEADFAAFKGENVIIPKDKFVDRGNGGSFMQAEFDSVCRLLSPALSKHGFGFRHKQRFGTNVVTDAEGGQSTFPWVWVTCILSHKGGHRDELELEGPADSQKVNSAIQNAQSAASLLKRQSLLAITGTPTGGEDDESKLAAGRGKGGKAGKGDATASVSVAGTPQYESLMQAGHARAGEGVKSLTDWWGKLTKDERDLVGAKFGELKKAAAGVRP